MTQSRPPGQDHIGAVVELAPDAGVERRNVLDRAHRGDLVGALGRVDAHRGRPLVVRRIASFLAVAGPGTVVMVANNDGGSISVFAQAGQDFGLRWIWLPALLIGALFVVQEMAARLGAVTGAGHARLIFERFGPRWGWFALGDLLVINVLTVMTEFIGLQYGLGYFGVSRFVAVPAGLAVLLLASLLGDLRDWERGALLLVFVSIVVAPLLLLDTHAHALVSLAGGRPAPGGPGGTGIIFALAIVGTAVSPWQLFFQQSNVVDKRITSRWLGYERVDTLVGSVIFGVGATLLIGASAYAFGGTALHGHFVDALHTAQGLHDRAGSWAGTLFAVILIDGSLLAAGVVTLTTGYALGEVAGWRHSRHRGWAQARRFYGAQGLSAVLAAGLVLVLEQHLGLITVAVQALAGTLFPSAGILLLLLCNDREVLGPWVNRPLHNGAAALLMGALMVLSAVSTLETVVPHVSHRVVAAVAIVVGVAAEVALVGAGRGSAAPAVDPAMRRQWTMPPLERLRPPTRWQRHDLALAMTRVYVIVTSIGLIVWAVRGAG
ncbi:MAG: divalent metal cation transporter [Actinomycetota bacterium]|nr:divalent metal cation transporter [Actinomycetota bacterium]